MKVMLNRDDTETLTVYVPKKDLEEKVVRETWNEDTCTLVLTNGWELEVSGLSDPIPTPKTVQAKRIN